MRRNRLVELVARLARVLEARARADDALPIDPSLLPLDLATWRGPL